MGFFAGIKANKAMSLQRKGDNEGARKLYEEALADGLNMPRPMLAYSLLLIRAGEFKRAQEVLVKTQKAPGITQEQKSQLFMDYAICCFKLGELERGLRLLERQHNHAPTGLTYGALGYLFVERYDLTKKPVAQPAPEEPAEGEELPPTQAELDAAWDEGVQKALRFNQEAVEYDDEDAICLDNLAQTYYRCLGDKATAKPYFDKAHAIRPGQIDTLWFLSRYDLEEGNTAAAIEKLEKTLEGRFSPLNFTTRQMVEDEIARLKGQ